MSGWKHQLAHDVDLVCWWHGCPREEKAQVIECARNNDTALAIRSFRAMAGEVHRAITFPDR